MLNDLFLTRTLNGKKVDPQEFDALPEFATICAMCNDSSVDYNTVSVKFFSFLCLAVRRLYPEKKTGDNDESFSCFFFSFINQK